MTIRINPSNDSRMSAAIYAPSAAHATLATQSQNSMPSQLRNSNVKEYHLPPVDNNGNLVRTPPAPGPRRPMPRSTSSSVVGSRRGSASLDHGDTRNDSWTTTNRSEFVGSVAKGLAGDEGTLACLGEIGKEQRGKLYKQAAQRIGPEGVVPIINSIRDKVSQKAKGVNDLRRAFRLEDREGRGRVGATAFQTALQSYGLEFSEFQVLALFGAYDKLSDAHIQYSEFVNDVVQECTGLSSRNATPVNNQIQNQNKSGAVVTIVDSNGRKRHVLAAATMTPTVASRLGDLSNPVRKEIPDAFDSVVKHGRRAGSRGSSGDSSSKQMPLNRPRALQFDKSTGSYSVQSVA